MRLSHLYSFARETLYKKGDVLRNPYKKAFFSTRVDLKKALKGKQ